MNCNPGKSCSTRTVSAGYAQRVSNCIIPDIGTEHGGGRKLRGSLGLEGAAMVARVWAAAVMVAISLMLSSKVCLAEPKIGNAVTVNNQVEGVTGGGSRVLATGSEVYSNELVRTSSESKAELLFLDNTNLSVG